MSRLDTAKGKISEPAVLEYKSKYRKRLSKMKQKKTDLNKNSICQLCGNIM